MLCYIIELQKSFITEIQNFKKYFLSTQKVFTNQKIFIIIELKEDDFMKKFLSKNYIKLTNMILFISLAFCLYLFRPVVVQGESMEPTLENGDTLICNTLKTPQIGDIVVIYPGEEVGNHYIIKRVISVQDEKIFVQGDNSENSYDSREFGWINFEKVLGVVIQ